jgi:hypothetical protein
MKPQLSATLGTAVLGLFVLGDYVAPSSGGGGGGPSLLLLEVNMTGGFSDMTGGFGS